MSEDIKKIIAIGAIVLFLLILLSYSIFIITLNKKDASETLEPIAESLVETTSPSEFLPALEIKPSSVNSAPSIVSIPTAEEIRLHIEDQSQKRKTMDALIEARNAKAEKVLAAVTADLAAEDVVSTDAFSSADTFSSAGSASSANGISSARAPQTISKNTRTPLSPEARKARNKELRDGIKAHIYFPR